MPGHFAVPHHEQELLLAQLLQRSRPVMTLLDVGEAAFAQHSIHDARHLLR
jgi:hypothetical protein